MLKYFYHCLISSTDISDRVISFRFAQIQVFLSYPSKKICPIIVTYLHTKMAKTEKVFMSGNFAESIGFSPIIGNFHSSGCNYRGTVRKIIELIYRGN